MGIKAEFMTSYATLCLKDRAAEHWPVASPWACMKKVLASSGKDPNDFEVFRFALLKHYVDLSVEGTVRAHLANLKQHHSVSDYHARFRDILVEAVLQPLSGPEAIHYFRSGLKRPIFELVMKDAFVRNDGASLEAVVRAGKQAEALLALLAGKSEDSARSPHLPKGKARVDKPGHSGSFQHPAKRLKLGSPGPAKTTKDKVPASLAAAALDLGVSPNLINFRWANRMCVRCGGTNHTVHECTKPVTGSRGVSKACRVRRDNVAIWGAGRPKVPTRICRENVSGLSFTVRRSHSTKTKVGRIF
jgi:Retrotransposon gag protein